MDAPTATTEIVHDGLSRWVLPVADEDTRRIVVVRRTDAIAAIQLKTVERTSDGQQPMRTYTILPSKSGCHLSEGAYQISFCGSPLQVVLAYPQSLSIETADDPTSIFKTWNVDVVPRTSPKDYYLSVEFPELACMSHSESEGSDGGTMSLYLTAIVKPEEGASREVHRICEFIAQQKVVMTQLSNLAKESTV